MANYNDTMTYNGMTITINGTEIEPARYEIEGVTSDDIGNIEYEAASVVINEPGYLHVNGAGELRGGLVPIQDTIQNTISQPAASNFEILSHDQSALRNVLGRIKEFHQWLGEEQSDLEEECGADLSAIVDKLEETFPELSGEAEDGLVTPSPHIDFDRDIEYFRNSIINGLGVSQEDNLGFGADFHNIPYEINED